MEHYGRKLKDIRDHYGLSQSKLAEKIDEKAGNINYWESLEDPPLRGILKVLHYFNEDMAAFFDEKFNLTKEEQGLLEKFRTAPRNVQEGILKILE